MLSFRHSYFFQAARSLHLEENKVEPSKAKLYCEMLSLTQQAQLWEDICGSEATQNLVDIYLELIKFARSRFDRDSEFNFLSQLTKLPTTDVAQRATWLIQFSTAASGRGQKRKALDALDCAIELTSEKPAISMKAKINKALILGYAGDFDSSCAIFNDVFRYCDANNIPALKASAYMNASVIFRRNQQIDKAHEYAIVAESSFRASGNISGAAKAVHQQSRTLFASGQREHAFKLIEEARAMFDLAGDRLSSARATGELAGFKLQCGTVDEAIYEYEQALAEFRQIHSIRDELSTMSNLGLAEYNKGKFDSALSYYSLVIDLARSVDDKTEEAYALALMADATRAKGDTKTAKLLADQASQFIDTVKLPLFQIVLHRILAELAAAGKDIYLALSYLSKSREMAGDAGYTGMHVLLLARESYFFSELGDFDKARTLGLLSMDEADNIDEGAMVFRFVATTTMARLEMLDGITVNALALREESHVLRDSISEDEMNSDQLVRFTIDWLEKAASLPR